MPRAGRTARKAGGRGALTYLRRWPALGAAPSQWTASGVVEDARDGVCSAGLDVNGCMRGRCGCRSRGENRTSHAERHDSGNGQNSPEAHDSSMTFPPTAASLTWAAALTAHLCQAEALSLSESIVK